MKLNLIFKLFLVQNILKKNLIYLNEVWNSSFNIIPNLDLTMSGWAPTTSKLHILHGLFYLLPPYMQVKSLSSHFYEQLIMPFVQVRYFIPLWYCYVYANISLHYERPILVFKNLWNWKILTYVTTACNVRELWRSLVNTTLITLANSIGT